jgi:YbbR domain-containing protein
MAGNKRENWLTRYNVGYKILAVCLAFLLWYFVAGQRDPLAKQTFNVPVEPRNLSPQLVSMEPLPQVTITVSGTKMLVQSLQDRDVHAYLDMSGQAAGVDFVPVKTSAPDNVQVLSAYPQVVRVNLDSLSERKVQVKVVLQGTPASGFMTLSPTVTPESVTVSGPDSLLGDNLDLQAVVKAAGASANITAKVPVQHSWSSDKLQVSPKEVEVVVPVVPSGAVKTVPVTADVQGTPAQGQTAKPAVVEPSLAAITGPPNVLAGISRVVTQPVDISGATGKVVKEVGLALPAGVYPVSQEPVRVTVEIGAAPIGTPE